MWHRPRETSCFIKPLAPNDPYMGRAVRPLIDVGPHERYWNMFTNLEGKKNIWVINLIIEGGYAILSLC